MKMETDGLVVEHPMRRRLRVLLAVAMLTEVRPREGECSDNDDQLMFAVAPSEEWGTLGNIFGMAREWAVSAVVVAFGEGDLPAEILLSEHGTVGGQVWPQCRLWSPHDGRLACIRPESENLAFVQDGRRLHRLMDPPVGDLNPGFQSANQRLIDVARQVPDELISDYVRDQKFGWPVITRR
ncbi:hypothetical protein J3454_15325 [Erythrobacter sp. NFXS35]|uniref:hypothetical protein n=1 Tax=Erythrobacter sp. NFXS35 TaxID=2818436 RepID=UPI0032DED60F